MNTADKHNFWTELPRPFFVLAPLANVTDAAFRRIIAKYSKPAGPQVMYTEFVSADGLVRASEEGKKKLVRDLVYTNAERPIVAQLFSSNPAHMEAAAALVRELGFDGIDINMGCPDRSIEKQGAGAALIKTPELAADVIRAAQRGAGTLPVSVKTRLGYNRDTLDEWLPKILECDPAVVTIHARTRKDMSKVPARWERIKRAVEIRDSMGSSTLIVGNGDAKDLADAREKAAFSGGDGVMLGRAIFGRPWLFDESNQFDVPQRLRITVEHAKLFEELLGDIKSFAIMKKHFKAYLSSVASAESGVEGFDGAKELRLQLMETENAAQVVEIVENFLRNTVVANIR